jgi:hypothetical protein
MDPSGLYACMACYDTDEDLDSVGGSGTKPGMDIFADKEIDMIMRQNRSMGSRD